jgi:hypothetical protein
MLNGRVADPQNFNAEPDPTFHFNADPDPHQSDGNLRAATTGLKTIQGSILSLHASIVSFHSPPDPYPHQTAGNLQPLVYRPYRAPFWAYNPPLWPSTVGYSDYDVFLENDEGSRIYGCKKLFQDPFVKHVFQKFEPFLANRALKFQKSANMT